jgi:hypothetical protein
MYRTNYYVPPTPPPRRSSAPTIVFGVVLGVIATVALGAIYLKTRARIAKTPATASAVASTEGPPSNTPGSEPTAEPPPMPPPDEPAPPPGTPSASLRARPPWAAHIDGFIRGEPTKQYAPQVKKPVEVFLQAAPLSGDVDRGFLICRFQTFGKHDMFAGDDLHARIRFGMTPEVANDGPEDANLAFVSAPLATLKKNESVRFEVYDRDVFTMEDITRPSVTYGGGALQHMDSGAAVECRQLTGEPLKRVTAGYAATADETTSRLAHAKLDGSRSDWGYPRTEIMHAQRAIADVAALIGWDDARTKKRATALDQAIVTVESQREAVFDRLHGTAKTETTVGTLHATLGDIACGGTSGHAGRCAVKVTVENRSDKPVRFGGFMGPTAYVANRTSGPVSAAPNGRPLSFVEIPANGSLELTLVPTSDVRLEKGPAIVGICNDGACGTLAR